MIFESGGARMFGLIYEAPGAGPHPTAIVLHGFPGNERNLDLAQAIRRAGWNAVFFHYRGAWGSEGDFGFVHVLEDVAAVAAALARPDFAARHRIDPSRLALVGHSMGGFAALVSASELPAVDCAASLAGANLGLWAETVRTPEGEARMAARARRLPRADPRHERRRARGRGARERGALRPARATRSRSPRSRCCSWRALATR